MSEGIEHATSVGQTGGLPGDNAHPATRRVAEDEPASTVRRGDVAQSADDGTAHGADDGSGAADDVAPDDTGD